MDISVCQLVSEVGFVGFPKLSWIHVGIGDLEGGTTKADAAIAAAAAGITVTEGGGSRIPLFSAFLQGVRANLLNSLLESERLSFLFFIKQ